MKKIITPLLLFTLGCLGMFLFCRYADARVAAVALADPASVATDWSAIGVTVAIVLGAFGTILGGVSVALHAIAPRTKTTFDDRMAEGVDKLHDKVDGMTALLKKMLPGAGVFIAVALGLACSAQLACTAAQHVADTAKHDLINCTGQALGTTPALNIPTLIAIANAVEAERLKCTPPGGTFSWSCAEDDSIHEGEVIGGCTLVQLVASAAAPAVARVAGAAPPDPGRAALEDFRARFAGGATFHTATGDI